MRNHVRRVAALAAVVTAGALALSGCSGSSGSGSKTITVQVISGSGDQMKAYIQVFKKTHPDITVKTTTVSNTAKTGSNLQVITSSDAPDVAIVPTNSDLYTKLTNGKQLLDLSDVWSEQKLNSRYASSLAAALKTDGKPYVVSIDSVIYNVLYYNPNVFKQAGITAPADHRIASYADLQSMVAKLKAIGKAGISIGPTDNYQSSWLVDAYLPTTSSASQLQSYLTDWQSAKTAETVKYTDAPFVNALKQVQQMGKDGVFQDGYLGQSVAQSEANFVAGKSGMLLDGSWSQSTLEQDKVSFTPGWLLLPPVDAGTKTQVSLYSGDAYGIPTRAQNPTVAKEFLESMMSVEGQSTNASTGHLPTVNDVPASAMSSLPSIAQELLADQKANGGQSGWTSIVPGGLGQNLIDPLIQQMWNGKGTPESIAQAVQTELDADYRK